MKTNTVGLLSFLGLILCSSAALNEAQAREPRNQNVLMRIASCKGSANDHGEKVNLVMAPYAALEEAFAGLDSFEGSLVIDISQQDRGSSRTQSLLLNKTQLKVEEVAGRGTIFKLSFEQRNSEETTFPKLNMEIELENNKGEAQFTKPDGSLEKVSLKCEVALK